MFWSRGGTLFLLLLLLTLFLSLRLDPPESLDSYMDERFMVSARTPGGCSLSGT